MSVISIDGHEFVPVCLRFEPERCVSVFAKKNNKSLEQTLAHPRYRALKSCVAKNYANRQKLPLGRFLFGLKQKDDPFYSEFLNKYGDLEYSTFSLCDPETFRLKGVYAYRTEHTILYIGRCTDSMQKRIINGYGKINPKNCYLDGQATNCRINALITGLDKKPSLWLHPMNDKNEIKTLESRLISAVNPRWNIQS